MTTHTMITSGTRCQEQEAEGHERVWTRVETFHLPINFFIF